jgi:hypothetical protein
MNTIPSLELQWLGAWWLEILVAVATLSVWAFALYATKHQPLKVRIIVGVLRTILLGSGWFLLHHPTFVREVVQEDEQKLAVLIDRSGSMGAEAGDNLSRYQKAYDVVKDLRNQDVAFDVFEFDQSVTDSLGEQFEPRQLSGSKTDFYASFSQFFSNHNAYSSVLVLSDGHDLGRFSQMSIEQTQNWLERMNAPPINGVLIGDQLSGPEVAIHSIDAPSFSYVRAPLRIRVTVLVRNLDDYDARVQLLEGEELVQFKELQLDDQGFGTVEFEIYPERQGEHLYTVSVPSHHLEANTENNRQQVLIDIGRDKINVLHISGSVTWDLQGMRAMFERNNQVDLTAFYIMRTREHIQQGVDNRMIPPDEMALVPFPTEEIFDRQLFSFDVVVFQDFDAGNYFSDSYQANRLMGKIREFVDKHHGGFIVIGGPRTASGPSLRLTKVADILPLVPPAYRRPYAESIEPGRFTDKGEFHPILRSFDPEAMPFYGHMTGLETPAETDVLLQDPSGVPFLATLSKGTGRSLFINTSSSWKWRRDALAEGGTADDYYDFWEQLLKWVIQDPSMQQVRLSATKTISNPLDVNIDVLLRNEDYEPAGNRNATLRLEPLDLKAEMNDQTFTTNERGEAQVRFKAERPGYYRLSVVESPWRELARPTTVFLGGSQDELRNLDLVPETLQRLTSNSGGAFRSATDTFNPDALAWGETERREVLETQRVKLRNWIWSLPILLLIAGIEWTVRRSSHLA